MQNLRNGFLALENYTYLNTAATGLLSNDLLNFRRDHDLEFLKNGSVFKEKQIEQHAATRETVGRFFNCKPARVALLPSFSTGFNFLLDSLPQGKKFLLLKNDYPSINLPVEARDFEVCYAEIDENLEENIEQAVAKNQPDFFAFSLVQWINGIKIDLDFLKKLKQKHPNLVFIADGTQFCGTEGFDFEVSTIDVLGASAYKWLNAGNGNAFFLFREKVAEFFSPKALGYGSTVGKYKAETDTFIGKMEPGHLDTLNFGSLKTALELQNKTGKEAIQQQIQSLSKKAKSEFQQRGLLEKAVCNRKIHSSIFNLKGNERFFRHLREKGIVCSQRGEGIRVSFHYFNTEKELGYLLKTIDGFSG